MSERRPPLAGEADTIAPCATLKTHAVGTVKVLFCFILSFGRLRWDPSQDWNDFYSVGFQSFK